MVIYHHLSKWMWGWSTTVTAKKLAHPSSQSWKPFPKTTKVVGFVPDALSIHWGCGRITANAGKDGWECAAYENMYVASCQLVRIKGIKSVRIVASPASNPVKHSPFFHWPVTNLDDWKSSDSLTFSISLLSMKVYGHAPQLGSAWDGPQFQHVSTAKHCQCTHALPMPFPSRSIPFRCTSL